jgi:hypothetical protein
MIRPIFMLKSNLNLINMLISTKKSRMASGYIAGNILNASIKLPSNNKTIAR